MLNEERVLLECLMSIACIKDDPYAIGRRVRVPLARLAFGIGGPFTKLGKNLVRQIRWIAPQFCRDPHCPNHANERGIRCNMSSCQETGSGGEAYGE